MRILILASALFVCGALWCIQGRPTYLCGLVAALHLFALWLSTRRQQVQGSPARAMPVLYRFMAVASITLGCILGLLLAYWSQHRF